MEDSISAEEFEAWLTPLQAVAVLSDQWPKYTSQSTLASMVGHGLLVARARVMIMAPGRSDEKRLERVHVHKRKWSSDSPSYDSQFWQTGRFDCALDGYGRGRDIEIACHGIRFDPDTVRGLLEPPLAVKAPSQPKAAATSSLADLPFPKLDEVERFSRAILHGWPDITLEDAYAKAVLWFPKNRVSRDKFRLIFRRIRGPKKPGRKPKTDD